MRTPQPDWDPHGSDTLVPHLQTCDEMRSRCPVAYSDSLGWSVFRHRHIKRVLDDTETFSNEVSRHLSIPNGLDPPRHTPYRRLIERHFASHKLLPFREVCERLTRRLVSGLDFEEEIEVMSALAHPFALEVQCEFVGWPRDQKESLRSWMEKSRAATLRRDRDELSRLAAEFERLVTSALERRRASPEKNRDDALTGLMADRLEGRPLTDPELTSILRNWTAGEVGTIASAVGILVHYLAGSEGLQDHLRRHSEDIPDAVEEILRLEGPLLTNRRLVRKEVRLGGKLLRPGDRLTLMWAGAQRDPDAFPNPTGFQLRRNRSGSLLYGAGLHACPAAPLARLELNVFLTILLQRTRPFAPAAGTRPLRAPFPTAGYSKVTIKQSQASLI